MEGGKRVLRESIVAWGLDSDPEPVAEKKKYCSRKKKESSNSNKQASSSSSSCSLNLRINEVKLKRQPHRARRGRSGCSIVA